MWPQAHARRLDDAMLDNMQRAVVTIHAPVATAEQRHAAQQFLDSVKQMNDLPLDMYAYALMDKALADEVRFFGFHLLEHLIRHRWRSLSPLNRQEVRKTVLHYLEQGTKDLSVEKRFIKEKAVALVIQIAAYDWPNDWKELLDLLVQIAGQGETQLELILITLRNLVEEIKVFNANLAEKRRREMNVTLMAALPDILVFFQRFIQAQYQYYIQARQSAAAPLVEKHAHLVSTVLTTVEAYLEWSPIHLITENGFPLIFATLLQDPRFRTISCDCLLVIIRTPMSNPEDKLKALFGFEYMDALGASLAIRTEDPEDDHAFQLKLATYLSLLGTKHLIYTEKHIPPNYDKYLTITMLIAQHPSLLLNLEAITFWATLLRNTFMTQQPSFAQLYPQMLAVSELKSLKLPFEVEEEEKASYPPILQSTLERTENDLEDLEAYHTLLSSLRSKMSDVLTQIAAQQARIFPGAKPELALRTAGERLQACIAAEIPAHLKKTSYAYIRLEGAIYLLETTLRGATAIYQEIEAHTEALRYVEGLLTLLYNYKPTNSLLMTCLVEAYKGFAQYYVLRPNSVQHILHKLLELVTFRSPEELSAVSVSDLSPETMSARRRASTTFIHICDEIPAVMLPHLESLLDMIGRIYAQGLLLEGEKTNLIEALVAVSNAFKDYTRQAGFVLAVLKTPVEEWTSAMLASIVSDLPSFLSFFGIITRQQQPHLEAGAPATLTPQQLMGVRKIGALVHTFFVVSRRATVPKDPQELIAGGFLIPGAPTYRHPMSATVQKLLPNVFQILRSIHTLWTPALREQIHPALHDVLDYDKGATLSVFGTVKIENQPVTIEAQAKCIASALSDIRNDCYALLGRLTTYGEDFYSMGSLETMLVDYVFAHIEHMQNRHLAPLLKLFIIPLVKNCPERLWPVLHKILPLLLDFLVRRLFESWHVMQLRNQGQAQTSEKEDMLEDKLLRDFTRDYVSWMESLLLDASEGTKKGELYRPSALARSLLSDEAIVVPLMRGMVGLTHYWSDSNAFVRATPLVPRLLSVLRENQMLYRPTADEVVGKELFLAAVRALHDPQTCAINSNVLLTIMRDIFTHLPRSSWPTQVMQALPAIREYYTETFLRKFRKKKEGPEGDRVRLDLVKRLMWPLMGDNPKSTPPSSSSRTKSTPARPTWFDQTDSLDLSNVLRM